MIIEVGKRYLTRNGREVSIIEHINNIFLYPITGKIDGDDFDYWTASGRYFLSEVPNQLDLVAEPPSSDAFQFRNGLWRDVLEMAS